LEEGAREIQPQPNARIFNLQQSALQAQPSTSARIFQPATKLDLAK
jgi:hypothetical protein